MPQTIRQYYAPRVRRGVKLLDKAMPKWEAAIDLRTLDLGVCNACMLGQIYGDYSEGKGLLTDALQEARVIYQKVTEESDYFDSEQPDLLEAEHYGFDVRTLANKERGWTNGQAYSTLTELWTGVVKSRRQAEVAAEQNRRKQG